MATGCGYSYREIDDMFLWEAEEVFAFWERSPPPYQMISVIAQMLGWKPRAVEPDVPPDLAELFSIPGMAVQRGPSPVPAIDLDEMRERNRQRAAEMAKRDVAAAS